MAEKNHYLTLFGYNYESNSRLMQAAEKLDVESYYAEDGYSHGSLHGLLFHLLRTEHVWRMILQTGQGPNPPLALEDFPDLPNLESRWQLEQTAMLTYINSLTDDELDGEMEATDWRGMVHKMKRWLILQHVILHGMQHRSEAAILLTRYGQSPGNLDFIFYQE
jgi:uncharacterized damage-inducible protein DinB